MTPVEERRFTLASGLALAARVHHPGAPRRVLAVHGWLDNAASFDAIASLLPDCEIVALDLAGHGRSDHRPPGAWYHYVDYLDELLQVLDQLQWTRSTWLGHSLGGALLSLLASACPARVEHLLLIESAGPLSGEATDAPGRLRDALDERMAFAAGKRLRVFEDLDAAVQARRQAGGLSERASRSLVDRGVEAVAGGWRWSSDPRLRLASPFRVDAAHVDAILRQIECPTLMLLADPPLPFMDAAQRAARLAALAKAERRDFPGHHHLHMETPAPLAEAIRAFLG
ncbi:alpha/beta fold hydrolase [Pseudofulvimonas gallinarii]|uniref:alpha/beta fold hydrolase n=1 Tax=Pseudofulvimonas gallinarii TaxID=634155 RepID=UPI0013DDC4BF|nr:alpha/beta hydrolase [Pseudofulvimonas gallinarii]